MAATPQRFELLLSAALRAGAFDGRRVDVAGFGRLDARGFTVLADARPAFDVALTGLSAESSAFVAARFTVRLLAFAASEPPDAVAFRGVRRRATGGSLVSVGLSGVSATGALLKVVANP